MRTIKLIIQYDGTNYCGWQEQPNGISIQEKVETALEKILGNRVRVKSSGRTDAGVHALAMPAAFSAETDIPLRAFVEGVNTHLPYDIAILEASEANPSFKPIGDAVAKHYRYSVFLGKVRSPLLHRTSWHVRTTLDLEQMEQAGNFFIGTHDFNGFRAANCTAQTSIRIINNLTVTRSGDMLYIDVLGKGFLKNMVRIMAGTLVDVGKGKLAPETIKKLLSDPDRTRSGVTAPAMGLCLMRVWYPEDGTPAISRPEAF